MLRCTARRPSSCCVRFSSSTATTTVVVATTSASNSWWCRPNSASIPGTNYWSFRGPTRRYHSFNDSSAIDKYFVKHHSPIGRRSLSNTTTENGGDDDDKTQQHQQQFQYLERVDNPKSGITTLTLNRPDKFNALSLGLLQELQIALNDIDKGHKDDKSCRVVILAAHGKAFCAGHDLAEIQSNDTTEFHRALFETCSNVMLSIQKLRVPVIAQVHGIATAAGCQLVAACDLAVAAAETAKFATSGIHVGLFCSTPAVQVSRSMSHPKRALELLLTGNFISAETACAYGLINQVVPKDQLEQATLALAETIAQKSPYAIARGKEMFYQQASMNDIQEAYAYATDRIVSDLQSKDAKEGIDAFVQKRKPTWKGF